MGGKIIKTVRFTTVIIGFIFLSLLFINSSVYGNGGKHEVTHGNDAGDLKNAKSVELVIQNEMVNIVV